MFLFVVKNIGDLTPILVPDTIPFTVKELVVIEPSTFIFFVYVVGAAKFICLFDDKAIIDCDNALFGVDIFIS
jgi:hypothetical protein